MTITRHNYEEFFIQYMDNELSSDHRSMVEAFVQLHPDLKEELEILMQYKLVPDESVVFANKVSLIKGDALINAANYEEWLLSYIDNELTADQKIEIDHFIAMHSSVKKEFQLLEKSKLQPEAIVFANKESLYRREEKIRFLPLHWQRVAAVLILALGIATFFIINNKSNNSSEPIVTVPVNEQNHPAPDKVEQNANESFVADLIEKQKSSTVPEEKDPVQQVIATVKKQNNNVAVMNAVIAPVKTMPVNKTSIIQPKQEPTLTAHNNLPKPLNNPNVQKNDAANNTIVSVNIPKDNKKLEALTNPIVTPKATQPSDFANASLIEEESQQDGKKNKFRGLFRKITRTLEKRTNIDATDDDGKLLVAGLAIKLK